MEFLRVTAFSAYLAAWLVLLIGAAISAIPSRRTQRTAGPVGPTPSSIVGVLLQGTAALPITISLPAGPLRPSAWSLAAALLLSPVAAAFFLWALQSARGASAGAPLVTRGPYRWLRHPIYFAFFAMLLATGLLTSAGWMLLAAAAMYIAGSELRITAEEAELERRFPADYAAYRRRTRWRYLPGVR